MASPAAIRGADEVFVRIPAVSAGAAAGGELQQRERTLNRFVRAVALWEWAGNAFGALAFLWATGVLLGGFCSNLKPTDFWFAMVIIFIEAFRIFSRNYKLDNWSLFGTTRALRWMNVSFIRMLARPQEGNEVVLVMGMWIDLVTWLPVIGPMFMGIFQAVLLILMSKMHLRGASQQTSRSQQCRRLLLLWAVMIAFIISYALQISSAAANLTYPMVIPYEGERNYDYYSTEAFVDAEVSAEMLMMVVAALLLISRPPIITNLTSTPWGRSVISLAKLIAVVSLAFGSVLLVWPPAFEIDGEVVDPNGFIISFTTAVLLVGSLQTPAAENCSLVVGCWIDATLHMLFLWYLAIGIPVLLVQVWGGLISLVASIVSVVAVLLIQNLQIPLAVLQVMISSSRFNRLQSDYLQLPDEKDISSPNMVPAIKVFYVLALCQGSLYIMASILGLFSFFLRRAVVRQSKLRGQQGAEAIDLYYESAYSTCMESGLFAARKTVSLASFAEESLSSNSSKTQLAGVLLLDNLLHEIRGTDSIEEMRSKIIRSNKTLSTLIAMLGWADERHRDIRLTAARIISNLADNVPVDDIPGTLKVVCSLLDTLPDAASINGQRVVANHKKPDQETSGKTTSGSGGNAGSQPTDEELGHAQHNNNEQRVVTNHQQSDQETSGQTTSANGGNAGSQPTDEELGHAHDNNGGCILVCVCQCWQWMIGKWFILEELPLTDQESLPILGMVILEKLARDINNCAEIANASYLISKIIGLISYKDNNVSSNNEQQCAVICASLNFVSRLASTGENIGATLRQELCNNSFLLNNLECVLEDSRSSPEIMKLVIDILTKLALDEDATKEIGCCKMIVWKIMHVFIGKDGSTDAYYDQSLRMAAGEALANLTTESPANCLVILEVTAYEIIKDLKNMLCEDEYRYVAASLLQNICAQAKDKLRHQDASNHLSSAFPMVMENIMSAEGKHLEVLIGLVSQICDMVPEPFIYDQLQLQTNRSELVQKLVGTLISNRKPNPEFPRMRRVIVEMAISIVKLCPCYATILREGGMMEALSKVEMTPSKVERHRVFYGNIGVVLESGPSLTALVATAKGLIHSAAPTIEVLLMQRMSFAPPAALVSSASKRAYDDLFAGNLTSSEVEALDELFPATNARTSRRLFSVDGVGSRGQQRSRPAL